MVSSTEDIHARLGYRLAFETVYDEPPYQAVSLIPVCPWIHPDIQKATTIVWDLPELLRSIQRPGGYQVLNCTCGVADDAELMALNYVAHPDDETVIWEVDVPGHRPALEKSFGESDGFSRATFRRAHYEADILGMLDAVLSAGTSALPVEEYNPNRNGDSYQRLQELAANWDGSRQPILRPGSRLEIGFFDDELARLNGAAYRDYLPRLFTRWDTHVAFEHWRRYFARGHGVTYTLAQEGIDIDENVFGRGDARNRFHLLHERDREACDDAGRHFAAALSRSFAEGSSAPDVIVEYRHCLIPAVLS